MKVVSSCPHCGSPIYGPESVAPGEVPEAVRTCACLVLVPLPAPPPAFPMYPTLPTYPQPFIGDGPPWWWHTGKIVCATSARDIMDGGHASTDGGSL